jgi:hypothetical protein
MINEKISRLLIFISRFALKVKVSDIKNVSDIGSAAQRIASKFGNVPILKMSRIELENRA